MKQQMALLRGGLVCALVLAGMGVAQAKTPPPYLTDAETLLSDLHQSEQTAKVWPNVYGSPAFIDWYGAQSTARTECSSFVTNLWEYAFGWNATTFTGWMGKPSPDAALYHDTIQAHNGFAQLTNVSQIQPGDIIAIVYYPETVPPKIPSGHVMVVQGLPQPNSSNPLVPNTTQWTISVIDSTSTYHGKTDTRYAHPGGIGQGIFRLYTHPDGTVAGYTWSLLSTSLSHYVPQATSISSGNHLVIGRLTKTQ